MDPCVDYMSYIGYLGSTARVSWGVVAEGSDWPLGRRLM